MSPTAPRRAPLHVRDRELDTLDVVEDRLGFLFASEREGLAVDLVQLGVERVTGSLEMGGHGPILLRLERTDRILTLADQPEGHRLDTTSGKAVLYLFPQQW